MDKPQRQPLKRFCTFQRAPTKWWQLPAAWFQPGPIEYLIHLERLGGIEVREFRYIGAIGDFEATLKYEDYELRLWMGWEGDLVLMSGESVPGETFDRVCGHLRHYKRVPDAWVIEFKKQYAKPAKVPWYEKQ